MTTLPPCSPRTPRQRLAVAPVMLTAVPVVLAVLCGGCALRVTPASIADSEFISPRLAKATTERWYAAVDMANAFLASPFRRTLPDGYFELDGGRGMRFVSRDEFWPMTVWNSVGGWLVVLFGFRAQERSGGFVVGSAPPDEIALIDHSMFYTPDGELYSEAAVAELILHETAHVVHEEGTVGIWGTACYYFEFLFTWRTTDHSAERLPNAVSEEFSAWWRWQLSRRSGAWDPGPFLIELEQHMALGGPTCRHELPD